VFYRFSRTLVVAGLLVATTTIPASADINGGIFGIADADLLQIEGVNTPVGCGDESLEVLGQALDCEYGLAQLVIGDTEARADSGATIAYNGLTGLSSYGHGSNLDADLLTVGGTEGSLSQDLLVQSDASQAEGEATDSDQLGAAPENPVIGFELATTEASALDIGPGNTSCPDITDGRVTIAHGRNELIGLRVAPDGIGEGQDLAATSNPEGVSFAESRIELVDALVGGDDDGTFGVESTSTVLLAPITLLGGEIQVAITQPKLVVRHDGEGMTVEYTTPIVTINDTQPITTADVVPLVDLLGQFPENPLVVVDVGIPTVEDVVIDGDTASLSGLVTLDISVAGTIGVVSLSLGDLTAGATAPAGGATIDGCNPTPPEVEGTTLEQEPELAVTGGGAAIAALLALGGGFAVRRRRD
jgi:hypothetical protein